MLHGGGGGHGGGILGVSLLYGPTLDGRACAGLLGPKREREREVAEQWAAVARLSGGL